MAVMITTEKIEEIKKLRAEGMNIKQIEAKTGISHGTIIKYTKKEPETAATETGSEQEICEDIPADIIPEAEENVKPVISQVIPQAVIEACWGRKSELEDQIAQEQAVIDDWERQIAEIDDFLELAKLCNPMGGTL